MIMLYPCYGMEKPFWTYFIYGFSCYLGIWWSGWSLRCSSIGKEVEPGIKFGQLDVGLYLLLADELGELLPFLSGSLSLSNILLQFDWFLNLFYLIAFF